MKKPNVNDCSLVHFTLQFFLHYLVKWKSTPTS